jgi:hypothetical protein
LQSLCFIACGHAAPPVTICQPLTCPAPCGRRPPPGGCRAVRGTTPPTSMPPPPPKSTPAEPPSASAFDCCDVTERNPSLPGGVPTQPQGRAPPLHVLRSRRGVPVQDASAETSSARTAAAAAAASRSSRYGSAGVGSASGSPRSGSGDGLAACAAADTTLSRITAYTSFPVGGGGAAMTAAASAGYSGVAAT